MPDDLDLDSINRNRFYDLKTLARASGLPVSSIRAAVRAGDLPAARMRQSCNAPIRARGAMFLEWVASLEENNRPVLSPTEAGRANARAG